MGLISNVRRLVSVEFEGRQQKSLQLVSLIQNGKITRVVAGRETGAKLDGSEYAVAFVQTAPGFVHRVTGYGENAAKILAMAPGSEFNAVLEQQSGRGGRWFKVIELQEPSAPEPAPAA